MECNTSSIDKLSYALSVKLVELDKLKQNWYKTGRQGTKKVLDIDRQANTIFYYKDLLKRYKGSLLSGEEPCLCCEEFTKVYQKIALLVKIGNSKERLDYTVDKTNREDWIKDNPYCVSRNKWEEYSHRVCKDLWLDLDLSIEKKCDLTFEFTKETLKKELIYTISVYKKMCDLDYTVDRTVDQCKLDYSILVDKTQCNIDFITYKKLVKDHNLSYDIIESCYNNGVKDILISNGEVTFETVYSSYNLNELVTNITQTPRAEKRLTSDYRK